MTNFQTKVVQFISNFLGYFEKSHSYVKTAVATSGVTWKKLVYFLPQLLVILPVICFRRAYVFLCAFVRQFALLCLCSVLTFSLIEKYPVSDGLLGLVYSRQTF